MNWLKRLFTRECNHDSTIPIAAQRLAFEEHVIMMAPVQTVVLKRCRKCGLHSMVTYLGLWTIGDFTRDKSEVDELRELAAK